jgi:hypothetical protein
MGFWDRLFSRADKDVVNTKCRKINHDSPPDLHSECGGQHKLPCHRCAKLISTETHGSTGGYCVPCHRGIFLHEIESFEQHRDVGSLVAALQNDYREVKFRAVEALVKLKDTRSVEPLLEFLKAETSSQEFIDDTSSCIIRCRILEVLAEMRDNRVIDPLLGLLKREANTCVKIANYELQSYYRGYLPHGCSSIWHYIQSRKKDVYNHALYPLDYDFLWEIIATLQKLTGQSHGMNWHEWSKWWATHRKDRCMP